MTFEYDYEDTGVVFEQYGRKPKKHVDAKYIPSTNPLTLGNPFAEALPVIRPYDSSDYIVRVPFKPSKAGEKDAEERVEELIAIDDVRVPFPFQQEVLRSFRTLLLRSAREHLKMVNEQGFSIYINNREEYQDISFTQSLNGDLGNGFCLVGFPGSTKTTTISELISLYPQVIIHHWKNRGISTQVPIVRVVCDPNDNLSKLYDNIGENLDTLLGNTCEHYCGRIVQREKSVIGKANAVANLLISYNVLALVLDEVQELDFQKNRSSSFHSIVTIVNKAKCGLVSVGTQEALQRIYSEWYAGDRAGEYIDTSKYCIDKSFTRDILRVLFATQWFDRHVELTEKIVDVFFECTGGSVRKIKALYTAANRQYIINRAENKKDKVDENYFRDIAVRKWDRLGKIIERNKKEYIELNQKLQEAKTKQRKQTLNEALEKCRLKGAERVAYLSEGDNAGALLSRCTEHLEIEGRKVNSADLEAICYEVYDKYSDTEEMTFMIKKVISRCKGKRYRSAVKDMYEADAKSTNVRQEILSGNV